MSALNKIREQLQRAARAAGAELDEIARTAVPADPHAAADCQNCDGIKCMACRCRELHDECVEDCPDCCPPRDPHAAMVARMRKLADELVWLSKLSCEVQSKDDFDFSEWVWSATLVRAEADRLEQNS